MRTQFKMFLSEMWLYGSMHISYVSQGIFLCVDTAPAYSWALICQRQVMCLKDDIKGFVFAGWDWLLTWSPPARWWPWSGSMWSLWLATRFPITSFSISVWRTRRRQKSTQVSIKIHNTSKIMLWNEHVHGELAESRCVLMASFSPLGRRCLTLSLGLMDLLRCYEMVPIIQMWMGYSYVSDQLSNLIIECWVTALRSGLQNDVVLVPRGQTLKYITDRSCQILLSSHGDMMRKKRTRGRVVG